MSLPKIIDNDRHLLADVLKTVAPDFTHLSIATGYWDLPGTALLLDYLDDYQSIRLLIGQEPLIARYQKTAPEPDFPNKDIFKDLQHLEQSAAHRDIIVKIRQLIEDGRLEVRVYKQTFFHAKAYIFGNYETAENVAVVGSSNFTRAGLTGNAELNGLEQDGRLIRYKPQTQAQEVGHLHWFDSYWDQAEQWSSEFSELISTSPVGDKLFSPYDMYIATLYQMFKEDLQPDDDLEASNSLYEFQRRNANLLLRKLKKYKLAMLSDSVGLGKTITAGSVIQQYLNSPEGRQRVEVIVPASLKSQWQQELAGHFGMHDVSIISMQNDRDLAARQAIDKDAEVKLFVIDEAHNLRSESGARYKLLFQWLSNNPNSHVLLLTATPINNQLADVANQIQLAAKGNKSTFKVLYQASDKQAPESRDFDDVIRALDASLKQQARLGKTIDFTKVKRNLRPVLSRFMVRATRQGIEKVYGGLVDSNGVVRKFPESIVDSLPYDFTQTQAETIKDIIFAHNGTLPVAEIYAYSLEDLLESTQRASHPLRNLEKPGISREALNESQPFSLIFQLLLCLGLPMYRDMLYMHRFYDKSIEELRQFKLARDDMLRLRQQMSIHNIIRVGYLKRLESSPKALFISIDRYRQRLQAFAQALEQGQLLKVKDIDKLRVEFEGEDISDQDIAATTDYADIDASTHNIDGLKEDIAIDLRLIDCIMQCLKVLSDDDKKLERFAAHLTQLQATQPAGKKVLVFSFYADTVAYLHQQLPKLTGNVISDDNAGFISGKSRKFVDDYTRRFAPNAKDYELTPLDTELNYLVSTDVLSEGQNLQDCGLLVNYDLHWNPVRMIQRNGRINRLGSPHEKVYVYNMHPAHQLEQYLRLVHRLNLKIELIRNSVGTDQPILGGDAAPVEFLDSGASEVPVETTLEVLQGDAATKQQALAALEEEADFSLGEDAFVADLRQFDTTASDTDKQRVYYGIPFGKWGMMPADTTVKRLPEALTLTNFTVAKDEQIIGEHLRFFDVKPSEGTFVVYDSLAALACLQTDLSDNKSLRDQIKFDKQAVLTMVQQYGTMLATSEYEGGEDLAPKPSQRLVLDYLLTKLGVDTNPIYDALTRGRNRVHERELSRALKHAGDKIKESLPISDADLLAITEAAHKLNSPEHAGHLLQDMKIIYNYARQ